MTDLWLYMIYPEETAHTVSVPLQRFKPFVVERRSPAPCRKTSSGQGWRTDSSGVFAKYLTVTRQRLLELRQHPAEHGAEGQRPNPCALQLYGQGPPKAWHRRQDAPTNPLHIFRLAPLLWVIIAE